MLVLSIVFTVNRFSRYQHCLGKGGATIRSGRTRPKKRIPEKNYGQCFNEAICYGNTSFFYLSSETCNTLQQQTVALKVVCALCCVENCSV